MKQIMNEQKYQQAISNLSFFLLALQPIVGLYFAALYRAIASRVRGFLITHNDTPQSVGLLWTSDQSVAETST
jgi:hypothetical protein